MNGPRMAEKTWEQVIFFAQSSSHKDEDCIYNLLLVGGWATPLKNMKVNCDDYSQYMGK